MSSGHKTSIQRNNVSKRDKKEKIQKILTTSLKEYGHSP